MFKKKRIEQLAAQVEQLTNKLKEAEALNAKLAEEIRHLTTKLDEERRVNEAHRDDITTLRQALKNATDRLQTLENTYKTKEIKIK